MVNDKYIFITHDNAGFVFTKILAEDNAELIIKLDIRQAPTLVIGEKKFTGISEIYRYINGDNVHRQVNCK